MGTQITPTGIKFVGHDKEQTAPVRSVNSTAPDADGNIEVAAGGGATYTSQDYHATTDFLFKDSKWYGEHMVYSYSTNASAIENLSVGSVLHEVGSDLSFSVVSIDAAANRITLNRGDFTNLNPSNRVLEDRENSTFGSTTFTYVSGTGNSMNCTNIWLQVIGNENHANTESLPTSNNSVANLPMKLDHIPSMATHIIFRVSSETGGSFKIYNRETFNVRPPTAELLPSEIVHQIDVEGTGTQAGFSEFRVPVNSYFRFWVTGGGKANLYPVGYSVLDLSEIDLESASNPVITALETRVNTLETNDVVTSVNGRTGVVTVDEFDGNYNSLSNKPSLFDGNYNSLSNKPTIPTDLAHLTDNSELLSSGGGGGRVLVFNSSDTYNKPAGVVGLEILMVAGGAGGGYNAGFYSTFGGAKLATAGGDTFITGLPDGEKRVKGGQVASNKWFAPYLEYMSPPTVQSSGNAAGIVYNWNYSQRSWGQGQGGYSGNDGGAKYPWLDASSGGAGGGGLNVPLNTTSHTGKSLSGGCGASANLGYNTFTNSLDGHDWHFAAPLGGVAGYGNQDNTQTYVAGGKGTFSGGGGGAYGNSGHPDSMNRWTTMYAGGGGGGIGAGGGGHSRTSSTPWLNNENGGWSGGFAGEHTEFIINVPSAAASYQIEVGAGGDGAAVGNSALSHSAGGGGQGIVIIKEISDLTISTP